MIKIIVLRKALSCVMSVGSGYLLTALIFEPVATPIELTTRAKYFTFVCLSFQVLDLDK